MNSRTAIFILQTLCIMLIAQLPGDSAPSEKLTLLKLTSMAYPHEPHHRIDPQLWPMHEVDMSVATDRLLSIPLEPPISHAYSTSWRQHC